MPWRDDLRDSIQSDAPPHTHIHWRGAFTLNYFHYCCCCYYYFCRWKDLRPAMMLCVYITRTVGFTLLRRVQSHKSHTTFPFLVFLFFLSLFFLRGLQYERVRHILGPFNPTAILKRSNKTFSFDCHDSLSSSSF